MERIDIQRTDIQRTDPSIMDEQGRFFVRALRTLREAGVHFIVGGGYAVNWYTGSHRDTKDLDILVTPRECKKLMEALAANGFDTVVKDSLWLAKAIEGPYFIDIIWGTGNWLSPIDEQWFENARKGEFLKEPVLFAPVEELIWVKAFIASRDRFDGSDVNHLILAVEGDLDWQRLLKRFGQNWEVLLANLILFRFVYPSKREYIPKWLIEDLLSRFSQGLAAAWHGDNLCRGSFLDIIGSYDIDLEQLGFVDGRHELCARHELGRTEPDELEELRCERLRVFSKARGQSFKRRTKSAGQAGRRHSAA